MIDWLRFIDALEPNSSRRQGIFSESTIYWFYITITAHAPLLLVTTLLICFDAALRAY